MDMETELLLLMLGSSFMIFCAGVACIIIMNAITIVERKSEQEILQEQFKEKLREEVKHDRM